MAVPTTPALNGGLKGDLFYTQDEAVPTPEGWVESDRTVDHKLISKEMFPRVKPPNFASFALWLAISLSFH